MKLLAIILVSLLFSCKTSEKGKTVKEVVKEKAETITFKEIASGENAKYKKVKTIIITTQQEMDLAWVKMFNAHSRKPPIPMIDFETNQLLLVTMGEQVSGGHSIKVNSIVKAAEGLVVTIENTKPGESCNTTSALIYPFQLVEMPKTEAVLSYVRISKINKCKE